MNLFEQLCHNMMPGPLHENDPGTQSVATNPLVKTIAFYLPQFHAIAENDRWWGKGFTEWTNVTKAIPRFAGHYQPRLPQDLGFYDLTDVRAIEAQAALAQRYGIHGFCIHYYWFGGQRLLEQPLELLLVRPDINIPFCVNWANESWTRRWDGHEKDILIKQEHSADDDISFARALGPLFRDARYIRIDGRPLLMLYRPSLLPDAAATVRRWRAYFTEAGIGNPYIVMAQIWGDSDPRKYGMDAVAGFPPFWASGELPRLNAELALFDPEFRGEVVDYEAMAAATVASYPTDVKFFPGVCPAWDNDARKGGRGTCFVGSTPAKYGRWLAAACDFALRSPRSDERLVFINAWNEWAEGAYLEPDRHFGHAYLAETARVLEGLIEPTGDRAGGSSNLQSATMPRQPDRRAPTARNGHQMLTQKIRNRLARIADDLAWKLRQP
jgi:lipopolysaccharide biosynthesis protein